MKIRADLYGRVHVHTPNGSIALKAGDEVPAGVNIDPSLVDGKLAKETTTKSEEKESTGGTTNRRGRGRKPAGGRADTK